MDLFSQVYALKHAEIGKELGRVPENAWRVIPATLRDYIGDYYWVSRADGRKITHYCRTMAFIDAATLCAKEKERQLIYRDWLAPQEQKAA